MENEIQRITAPPPQDSPPSLPNLPEEMLKEILLRLPVKSLLRFRCVSKSWLFLISSNDFVKAHLKFSAKNDVYIHDKLIFGSRKFPIDLYTCSLHSLVEDYGQATTDSIYSITHENILFDRTCFDSPYIGPDGAIELIGSCNGLVCVYVCLKLVILWNPATSKSRRLPESGTDLDLPYEFCYATTTYGFGYDELHDDYKVVEFLDLKLDLACEPELQVKVYSTRTNSWKTLSNWPGGYPTDRVSKFLNGAIHWLVYKSPRFGIVSHTLENDTFVELPMPNFDGDDDGGYRLEVNFVRGCLAVCCVRKVCMDVWVMKEYGVRESWTKFVSIPFFMSLWGTPLEAPKPLFLSMDGKILMNYGSSLRIYDSHKPHHEFDYALKVEATTYIESLVSPDLDDGIMH